MVKVSELVVPTEAAYLELIGDFVGFVARRVGFPPSEVARIRLAVDEAAANVVLHAVETAQFETFRVICEEEGTCLRVRVRDEAPPFDWESVAEPNLEAPVEQRKVGGLGLYLMRRVMDRVELRPVGAGKEIVLSKELPDREGAVDGD
ncbi:MAG: ATP-binding protein [Fimbriimonadaceae bacterium]|nr:ATP-binding protein [Fimbriimonadaceae bacterium]